MTLSGCLAVWFILSVPVTWLLCRMLAFNSQQQDGA